MKKCFYELKVVKTVKPHKCIVCEETIGKGELVLVENGFNRDEGYFNNYFHRSNDEEYSCHDAYIDCMFPEDDEKSKMEDPDFRGQISYHRWEC